MTLKKEPQNDGCGCVTLMVGLFLIGMVVLGYLVTHNVKGVSY